MLVSGERNSAIPRFLWAWSSGPTASSRSELLPILAVNHFSFSRLVRASEGAALRLPFFRRATLRYPNRFSRRSQAAQPRPRAHSNAQDTRELELT